VNEDDDVTTAAWLLKLVRACDRALERLSSDDPTLINLRTDISDFRSSLHAQLTKHRAD
jgi:hypothetical protein